MSLVRPVETSWEMSNWKQVSMWIPDGSEIFTQSSAGCALLYSTGSQGQTAQALGHLWLMAPDQQVSSILQGALRGTAVPNSHSLERFLCAWALNCILRPWCSALSYKGAFQSCPSHLAGSCWGKRAQDEVPLERGYLYTQTEQGAASAGARKLHWVKNSFVFENWL